MEDKTEDFSHSIFLQIDYNLNLNLSLRANESSRKTFEQKTSNSIFLHKQQNNNNNNMCTKTLQSQSVENLCGVGPLVSYGRPRLGQVCWGAEFVPAFWPRITQGRCYIRFRGTSRYWGYLRGLTSALGLGHGGQGDLIEGLFRSFLLGSLTVEKYKLFESVGCRGRASLV